MGQEPTPMESTIAKPIAVGPSRDKRVLRIGLMLGGNLIEETLLRKRATVTIGQSLANTFSVPIAGLPAKFPVFELVDDRFFLHFRDDMDGRLSLRGVVRTTAQLRQEGAVRRGQNWVYALDENSRGRISLGAMTLLFQFVTPPPIAAKMRLPASTRMTLADRFEPRLTAIVSASVLAHLAIGIFAYTRDLIIERPAARYARTYSVSQYEQPLSIDTVDVPVVGEKAGVSSTAPSTQPHLNTEPNKSSNQNRADRANVPRSKKDSSSQAAINEAIDNTVVVSVMTGLSGPNGAFGEMSDSDQSTDLDKSLRVAKRKKTSLVALPDRHRDRHFNGIGDNKGDNVPDVKDPEVKQSTKKEEILDVPPPKIGRPEVWDDIDGDPAAVANRVRKRYLAGVRRCHQRALVGNAEAHGKVTIEFTISPSGRVTRAAATGFDGTVDKCIESLATRWRFSGPKSNGKPTSASYSIPLLLKKPR